MAGRSVGAGAGVWWVWGGARFVPGVWPATGHRGGQVAELLVLAALVGCGGPPPDYVSRCGVAVYERYGHPQSAPAALVAGYQAVEDRTAVALGNAVAEYSADSVCEAWRGWSVQEPFAVVDADGAWTDYRGRRVYGLAWCDYKLIEAASLLVLPHELAHAAENCWDLNHETWAARGVDAAISAATAPLLVGGRAALAAAGSPPDAVRQSPVDASGAY